MKHKKKHKWKYRINVKKKIVVLIILGVSLFVGLGYAILGTNLRIGGTLEVAKLDKTLYGVMRKDTAKNIAAKYSGEHIDSVTEQGTEPIYYYNNYEDPDNVIFAGTCWKMYRTTDTGGIKLLYNGEPENGKCTDDRGNHVGYNGEGAYNLNDDYWYGTDYTYDPTTNQFSLKGTKNQERWNDQTYTTLLNKYTCRSTSENGTCSTLYYVTDYKNSYNAYVHLLVATDRYRFFGLDQFNRDADSPAYLGYMYDNLITKVETKIDSSSWYRTSTDIYSNRRTLGTSYYYADSYDYGQTTPNYYTLTNPTQITSSTDYSTLVGKYIMDGVTSDQSVYYVMSVDGGYAYTKRLYNGDTDIYIKVADSVSSSGGTYTLDNPTSIELKDWFLDYSNYNYKYTCGDGSNSCAEPRYIYAPYGLYYYYVSGDITISKTRNGFELVNPITIPAGEWYKGYDTTYKDYKYSCGNSDTTCTSSNLRYITAKGLYNYNYVKFQYFGNSVEYVNGEYKLKDVIEIEDATNPANIATHHYMCPTLGETTCSEAAYIFYSPSLSDIRYMPLKDEIDNPIDLLDSMFKSNVKNSTIKAGIEGWYKKFIYMYDDMVEDAIYCNNRSYDTTSGFTFEESGWNDNGTSSSGYLYFKDRNIMDLSCTNPTDRFSTSNQLARTNYKVGLMTVSEASIVGDLTSTSGMNYKGFHLMSSREFQAMAFTARVVGTTPGGCYAYIGEGVRPVITLKNTTEYLKGTGTMEDPYIVKVEGWSLQNSMFPIKDQQWMYLENGKKLSDGWHQLNDSHGDPNMYYFENGYSYHGWKEIDNNKYYLSTFDDDNNGIIDGRRLTNETKEIDGVEYSFDENGICTNCN